MPSTTLSTDPVIASRQTRRIHDSLMGQAVAGTLRDLRPDLIEAAKGTDTMGSPAHHNILQAIASVDDALEALERRPDDRDRWLSELAEALS